MPLLLDYLNCPWPDTDGPDPLVVPSAPLIVSVPPLTHGTKEWEYVTSGRSLRDGHRSSGRSLVDFGREPFERMSRSPNTFDTAVRLQQPYWVWVLSEGDRLLDSMHSHVAPHASALEGLVNASNHMSQTPARWQEPSPRTSVRWVIHLSGAHPLPAYELRWVRLARWAARTWRKRAQIMRRC